MAALLIALGGGLGALMRYWLEGLIAPRQRTPFPLSTLVVNISGSTLFGALAGMATEGGVWRSVLPWAGVGLLGGYTTFSTFSYETVKLIEDGAWRYAVWNLALSGPLSFAGAALAYLLVR